MALTCLPAGLCGYLLAPRCQPLDCWRAGCWYCCCYGWRWLIGTGANCTGKYHTWVDGFYLSSVRRYWQLQAFMTKEQNMAVFQS